MESVDKLRVFCDKLRNVDDNHVSAEYVAERCAIDVRRMADEIEREIAERFVELPLDADGVPWHIGDMVEGHGMVHSLDLNRHGWAFFGMENAIDPAIHRHAKSRTIVDVLADFAAEVEQGRNTIETARKYADELREMMGVE